MSAVRRACAPRRGSAVVAALTVIFLAGCGSVSSTPAGRASPGEAPAGTDVISASDVQRAVDDLAGLGIETRVRPSDATSIAPIQAARSLVRLLRFQVRNLALEQVAGGGIRGTDLDALSAAAGGGPVSQLLTAWTTSGPTPAASWAASLISPAQPADAAASIFPTLALVAFVADATSGSGQAANASSRPPIAVLAAAQAGHGAPARLAVANGSDFCTEVSAYLSTALGDIVDADASPPAWLRQLIDLYAPQYANDPDALRRTIGAMALLSYATSLARPWTVNLVGDPLAVAYGIEGQDPVQGDVVLTVASGGDVLVDDVADCAALADAQLASVPIEGSSVVWDSSGLGVHAIEVSSTTKLDDIGSASLTYQTAAESQEVADQGDPVTAQVWVNAWVDRAEMAALAAVVRSILLGEAAGSPAGPTAKALYQAMEPTLNAVMRPSGFALIDVAYHTPKASPSPGPSGPPATDVSGTWEGTWQNDIGEASGGFTWTLSQTGDRVTGTSQFSGPTCVGEVPIEGTVRGSTVELPMPSEWDIRFVGTLDGDSMSGTYSAIACWPEGFIVTGTWQATRE